MAYLVCAYRTYIAGYVVLLALISWREMGFEVNGGGELCRCTVHLGVRPIGFGCTFFCHSY